MLLLAKYFSGGDTHLSLKMARIVSLSVMMPNIYVIYSVLRDHGRYIFSYDSAIL